MKSSKIEVIRERARKSVNCVDDRKVEIEQQKQAADLLREDHKKELDALASEIASLHQKIEERDQLVVEAEEDARDLRSKFRRAQEQIAVLLEQQIELRQSSISRIESADSTSDDILADVGSMDIVAELSEEDPLDESEGTDENAQETFEDALDADQDDSDISEAVD